MIGAHRNQDGEFHVRRDEHPTRRKNPGGDVVYVARATTKDGRRSYGTFAKKGPCKTPAGDGMCCAQHRIYWAYEQDQAAPATVGTVGVYAENEWLRLHPRSERSDRTHEGRLRAVLDVDLGDGPLRDMLFADVEHRHGVKLLEVMLTTQGRAATGAKAILSTLSAMWQDALDDGWTKTANPFLRVKVRAKDPRVQKPARKPRVWSWEDMHAICAAAGPYEAMLRVMSDLGLRLGEVFPIHRADVKLGAGACDEAPGCVAVGPHLHVRWRAWEAREFEGTKSGGGERVAPIAPGLAGLLAGVPTPMLPEGLMFAAPGGGIWWEPDWRRSVWALACARAGVDARPHDFRHSWVSFMRAALIDVADVADAAGHSVQTQTRVYTHALGRSHEAMRRAVGE